jgi:hypothetical protein
MNDTRLVVKRLDNQKEISRYKKADFQLIADHLALNGMGGGIIEAILPQNTVERDFLQKNKKKFYVKEVSVRRTIHANARNAARSKSFLKEIGQWLLQRNTNWRALGILVLAKLIEREHKKIYYGRKDRDLFLEKILLKYQLELVLRRNVWWEEQLAKAK